MLLLRRVKEHRITIRQTSSVSEVLQESDGKPLPCTRIKCLVQHKAVGSEGICNDLAGSGSQRLGREADLLSHIPRSWCLQGRQCPAPLENGTVRLCKAVTLVPCPA